MIIKGIVIKGNQRGKNLGFPTANINLDIKIDDGIYISETKIENSDKKLPSVTFIGAAQTFGETDIKAETYILNFNEDLYGKEIEINLIKKIRGNKKFNSKEELIKQMDLDILEAKIFFS